MQLIATAEYEGNEVMKKRVPSIPRTLILNLPVSGSGRLNKNLTKGSSICNALLTDRLHNPFIPPTIPDSSLLSR